ncbi:hypothetical protein BKA70DRAFT_1427381 [Coprinopsis sp. MPI-PUGE-AT-0042]|nr:hypothetical protein BKA70DRAFT_1427381 [Coprinopsis sp. MPI-PUGE-AT-0042]
MLNPTNPPATVQECQLRDRPITSRRHLRGYSQGSLRSAGSSRTLGSSGNPSTPTPSSQSSVIMPIRKLCISTSSRLPGINTDDIPAPSGSTSMAGATFPTLLPPASINSGLYYSYDGLGGSSTSSRAFDNPEVFTEAEMAAYTMYDTPSPSRVQYKLPGPSIKRPIPRSADAGGKGKKRRTRSESLESIFNKEVPSELPFGSSDRSSTSESQPSGTSAESELRGFSRSAGIVDYNIPDSGSDNSSYGSSAEPSSSLSDRRYGVSQDPYVRLVDQLQSIIDEPQVSSDGIPDESEVQAPPMLPPLGAFPSFMPLTLAVNHSPISIRGSSEAPEPNQRPARLRQGRPLFVAKEFDPALIRGVQSSNPTRPISMLLHEVANPGPGITPKELQSILRKCNPGCNKLLYVLGEDKHLCHRLVAPIVDEPLFELQEYLLSDNNFGITQAQVEKVFSRCIDCDHYVWSRKVQAHMAACPRFAPRA